METIRNHHPYKALDTRKGEIRVLELLPGPPTSKIRVKLKHECLDLNSCPPIYDAVSYMWGDSSIRNTIILDDNESFVVTTNAEQALRDLRSEQDSVFLWLDAICINQDEITERNEQVKIMQRIYTHAQLVRIWLDIDMSPYIFSILKRLVSSTDGLNINSLGDEPEFWLPFINIVHHPYWNRVWVQQELFAAKTIVVHFRNIAVHGGRFLGYSSLLKQKLKEMESWECIRWKQADIGAGSFRLLGKAPTPAEPIGSWQHVVHPPYGNLLIGLAASRRYNSTDPRDKVYGFMGLINDVIPGDLEITYEDPVEKVYTDVAELLMTKYKSLNLLLEASLTNIKQPGGLPTWVPNWNAKFTNYRFSRLLNSSRLHGELLRFDYWGPKISESRLQLHVHASFVEKIGRVWQMIKFGSNMNCMDNTQYLRDILDILGNEQQNRAHSTVTRLKALLRIIGAGSVPDERLASLEIAIIPLLSKTVGAFLDGQSLHDALTEDESAYWTMQMGILTLLLHGRIVAEAEDGSLLSVPEETLVGDEVWIVIHCSTPIVLRPWGGNYKVVGPAFIDQDIQQDVEQGLPGLQPGDEYYKGFCVSAVTLV